MKTTIITAVILLTNVANADTCLYRYKVQSIEKNIDICTLSPLGLGGVNDFALLPFTTTTVAPVTTPLCIIVANDYKKSKQLIEQGLVGDGLLLREVAQNTKIEITQLSARIKDFNTKTALCNEGELMSFSELVQYLSY